MAVTVYRSDDTGAPEMGEGVANATLIGVLQACLVDGYGSKAAAGWTKPYDDGAGIAAFRQGGGQQRYLQVDETQGDELVVLRGYETMSDATTGTNPFPDPSAFSGAGTKIYKSYDNDLGDDPTPWVVVANDKAFFMWLNIGEPTLTPATPHARAFYFGDFTSYLVGDTSNTIIAAENSTSSFHADSTLAEFYSTVSTDTDTGCYIQQDYLGLTPGTRARISPTVGADSHPGINGAPFPDPITGGMLLDRYRIVEPTRLLRGHIPCLFAPLHDMEDYHFSTITGTGTLSGVDFQIFGLYDGRHIAVALSDAYWP